MKEKSFDYVILFDFYGSMLSAKQHDFFDLYYNHDLSLGEIADNEGITRQGVRDAISRAEDTLSEFEDKLGLASQYLKYSAYIDKIQKAATDILSVNERSYQDTEIRDCAEIISELAEKMYA